jgi:tetratricopeptide (TPR) repeat protein
MDRSIDAPLDAVPAPVRRVETAPIVAPPLRRSGPPPLDVPDRELETDEPPTARASAPIFERTTTSPAARRFVDVDPATIITSTRARTDLQTEPVYRPSLTELTPRPSMTDLVPRVAPFDDDALPDETSFDELQIESAQMAAVSPDEPIDDDLGSMSTSAIADRRRTVVVFGIVEGTSSMTRDAMRPVTRSLGELAYQRGGVVLALDDDGLLVAFGLEVAGEDDVAIAMGWALDASSLARETAGAVLKIGARTGVGTTAASDGVTRVPQDASDEARALAREAAPDRPLFVGGAGRVTSNLYALREVPAPRSHAGSRPRIPRRSRVIEVVGPRGFAERDRARLERKSKLVGRVQQLAELEAWLARAIGADRRLVTLVAGAAGTGKSRLVAEMIARHPELQVTSTAASPASRLAPFSLVIDLYQAALALPPARGRGARAQLVHRLIHLMTKAGATLDRARVIAVDLDRAMELRDGVSVGAPEVADLRPRISAGLAAFRETMLGGAALTIIEDIHLGDTASLEVMRHTLAVTAQGPELLLLTSRGDHSPAPPVDAVITVGDLVGAELRTLIADRLGEAATPYNIAAVIARGGGNPLFIEELARAVREAGEGGEDVPASARDVVVARIERLSPRARTTLRFASVFGGTLRARLLEELLGEESLAAELDELVEAGVLVRSESAAGSSEGELSFARGLVREVVYESLSGRQQRDSHAQIGRLLASRFFAGREEPPAVIAEHLERGGEPAGAAAFWLRAGRVALAASDADAAIIYFSHALSQEREIGPTPTSQTSRTRRREALAGREEARRLQGDLASDPHDLDELEELCSGSPARLADVSIRRAMRLLRLGDYANANVATIVAENHAATAGDDRLRGEAMRVRGEILERLGQFDEALDTVAIARELFARQGAVAEEMQAMVGRGRIHLMRAHYQEAHDAYRPVLARIAKTGDPWLERIVKNHVAVIEMCLGKFADAMVSAERSLELCRRYGDRAREGDACSVSGIILLEVGLYDDAADRFAEALDILSRTASRWSRADCLIYAGTCEVRRGHDPEAREQHLATGHAMLDEAVGEARRLGARYLEANALVGRSGALLARGELGRAIDDAAAATKVAREATLVGYEIQGLARHALAIARAALAGDRVALGGTTLADARILVDRALALLDEQRYLEGSEEEVLAACVEVLITSGAAERAEAVKQQGRAGYERKLAMLRDPAWRAAYAAVSEHRFLLS